MIYKLVFKKGQGLWLLINMLLGVNSYAADYNINASRVAYLWNFSMLIGWPPDTIYPDNQFVLCAATDDRKDIFQLSTIKEGIGDYTLKVRYLQQIPSKVFISGCHLLFISKSIASNYKDVLIAPPKNTLLVTEGDDDLSGDIHLYIYGSKLKFNINHASLVERDFEVSSKLLYLSGVP